MDLLVHEILHTIQGEGTRSGRPCVIVRLLGCNLACRWCDTDQSGVRGVRMGPGEIVARVRSPGCPLVEVTGGEPLVQDGTIGLLEALVGADLETVIETNGSLDVSAVPPEVSRIVDLKPLAATVEAMEENRRAGRLPEGVNVERDGREVRFRAWPYENVLNSVWEFLERQGVRWVPLR